MLWLFCRLIGRKGDVVLMESLPPHLQTETVAAHFDNADTLAASDIKVP